MTTDVDKGDIKAQTCLCPELYQGDAEWAVYTIEDDVNKRLRRMANRLHEIGIQRPSEQTFAAAAAIALCNDGLRDARSTLQHTRLLKTIFTNIPHRCLVGPLHYPDDPARLAESHPVLWDKLVQLVPCVECKVPEYVAAAIKAAQPCRVSRTGCGASGKGDLLALAKQQLTRPGGPLAGEPPSKLPKNLSTFLENMATPQQQQRQHQAATITFGNGETVYLGESGRHPEPPPEQLPVRKPREHATPVGDPQFCGLLTMALEDRQPGLLRKQSAFLAEGDSPAIESQSETQTESQSAESQPAEIQPQLQLARQIAQVPSAAPTTESTEQVFGFVSKFQAKMAELPPKLSKKQTKVANTAAKATKMRAQKVGARAKKAPAKRKLLALKDAVNPRAFAILASHALIYKAKEILPRYFGCVTIYTDVQLNLWRVKPGKGRRDEKKFSRSPANWEKLVVHVKGLKQY